MSDSVACSWLEDPCGFTTVCIESHCTCSLAAYFIASACLSTCEDDEIPSWANYSNNLCTGNGITVIPNLPTPLPSGIAVLPSWVLVMVSETPTPTTFDARAASSIALSIDNQPGVTGSITGISVSGSSTSPSSSSKFTSSATTRSTESQTQTLTSVSDSALAGGKLPTRAIIGIVCGIIAFLLVGCRLVHICRRRRRPRDAVCASVAAPSVQLDGATQDGTPKSSQIQFNAHTENTIATAITKVRRRDLEIQMRLAQERIQQISTDEEVESPVAPAASNTTREESQSESDVTRRLREQNAIQEARIRELEAHMMSPWALGPSDEPPQKTKYKESGSNLGPQTQRNI
ncbi:hypothetical protein FB45DRAFT_1009158 [Roridomyces roridus]|uniref:Uncharacterized protein n=1 Tax=Roridomyces roridus TaxID=1738132 RepID=A0AAD7B8B7_9AGAR|nr:hypothetical protein FB45DRAFT_1009158 [Roridomyces roridus]